MFYMSQKIKTVNCRALQTPAAKTRDTGCMVYFKGSIMLGLTFCGIAIRQQADKKQ